MVTGRSGDRPSGEASVLEGRRIDVRGTVQGVGFRPWIYRLALEEGLSGRVRNQAEGVRIEAFGTPAALSRFLRRIETDAPPAAIIREIRATPIPAEPSGVFSIGVSEEAGERLVSIPPDLATCAACLAEVGDPSNRRYRYPFTNCTDCGPRFSIATDVPYDRPSTSMARFVMCARCRGEYEDPLDRRFHAQPNACSECGPQLRLCQADSAAGAPGPRGEAALQGAAEVLRQGLIVAVKGLGGFHLACDATSAEAVRRLRERKHRDEKPFAVMVPDLERARRLAIVSPEEAALLEGVERPIVLLRRQAPGGLADEVAPGNPLIGLLLAYTPLHHLLLAAVERPLVMTSGNVAEEPMAAADAEALERLVGIADAFLLHDRPIVNRSDDSVARVIGGRPVLFRRSRGYVPRPVRLRRPVLRPVLACGAQLKNTFCLAAADRAWLGPHVGDLDSLEACRSFEEQVERLQRFLGIRPELIAHDLHPDYASTRYALGRAEALKVGVQHHHAHVVSAMAEYGIDGPVLGLAWDGTGYGPDGTAWGGELLLARTESFERLATLRALPLAGGDQAIRQVWRLALAALDDAFDGEPPLDRLELFGDIAARDVAVVRRMTERGVNSPRAHGAGRWFDAIGAMGLLRTRSTYEGQVALEWNLVADEAERGSYPFVFGTGDGCAEVDLRPLVRAAAGDLVGGVGVGIVSGRFHNAMADVAAEMVRRATADLGHHPVILTGGCFQNARLAESVRARLAPEFDVLLHGDVPPGDGGIALGQAVVADAVTSE